ncbi:hypothetical protein KGQ20_13965 [Catenulispora sp. NF23]|uniref:Lipoprotein n=1 Tax=Catenulispora pinistramenti TaxID=2705254 RepID=A0ABS5KIX5_9ACTN|nr:hypothetical protein [Catenulispora pinistramenti]MBS2533875.1 hypothetical protein [Catenulispora pinistramenti]MBS2545419.1 hypothetical protein [Catenulispora pinistramenti]
MKPLVKTVATTAVVLTALAGCASRSSGGSSASNAGAGGNTASSSTPSSPASPSSSAPSSGGASNPSNPSDPGTVKYVSPQGVVLEKDGVTLATEVNWGGCNDQPQLVVMSQDASKVVVELKTVSHYRVGMMCPDNMRNGEATVKLAAPLASRQVIDGVKNVALSVS